MDVVVFQSRSVFNGKLFPHLDTARQAAQRCGNTFHVLEEFHSEGVERFHSVYRHCSPNGEPFERFCFARWIMLAEWMEANNRDVVFHCDSDTLLFADLDAVWRELNCPCPTVPYSDGFITQGRARWLADRIQHTFEHEDPVAFCAQFGHVSDLNMIPLLDRKHGNASCDLSHPARWLSVFDRNLCTVDLCKPFEGHKDIWFIKGSPYWIWDNGLAQMLSLHCWGPTKKHMPAIFNLALSSESKPLRLKLEP